MLKKDTVTFWKPWKTPLLVVVSALTFASACARFVEDPSVSPTPEVVVPDARDMTTCPDPGVGSDEEYGINEAIRDLAATRQALALCRRRQANLAQLIREWRGEANVSGQR